MTSIVTTRSGQLEGVEERPGVLAFKNIPFAAPPVGALRWKAPQREAEWDGVRDATQYGPYIAQNDMMLEQLMGGGEIAKSEDALALNVWTPSLDGSRPVMVWIHGGAFMFGSGVTPWYDGTKFARTGDVVLVTINYRLGPFGFMYLRDEFGDEFADSGNLGILDQIAALEWVHECIAAFGGDPNDVTIFGESAGAGSVGTLLGTPAARPGELFHKAILQSGAASWGLAPQAAAVNTRKVLDALGVAPGDRDALYAKTADEILAAAAPFSIETSGATLPYAPVHDGVVLPHPPLDAIAAGSARGVAVLCGTNLDEMTLFNLMDPSLATIDEAGLVEKAKLVRPDDAEVIVKGYLAERPEAPVGELWTAVASDAVFRMPAIALVDAHLAHGPAWMYLFTWPSPAFGGALKACHALEIPFVFDNLDQPGAGMFTGDGPERAAIAERMHAAWIAFARGGDPQHGAIPAWPAYDTERRATMRIDADWQLLDDPYGAEREIWASAGEG